jgi:hypothetical protein
MCRSYDGEGAINAIALEWSLYAALKAFAIEKLKRASRVLLEGRIHLESGMVRYKESKLPGHDL